jgi:hypothetical protein
MSILSRRGKYSLSFWCGLVQLEARHGELLGVEEISPKTCPGLGASFVQLRAFDAACSGRRNDHDASVNCTISSLPTPSILKTLREDADECTIPACAVVPRREHCPTSFDDSAHLPTTLGLGQFLRAGFSGNLRRAASMVSPLRRPASRA